MEYGLFDTFGTNERIICGTDEAGRGPLAGPVVAAAVVLPEGFPIHILNDSKKMKEKERLEVEKVIKEKAVAYYVVALSHKTIDQMNILRASLYGMSLCLKKIQKTTKVDVLMADGNKCPEANIPVEAIVKGDAKVPEIMAASILAKNHRDRLMVLADRKYPGYGFADHKGYPTKAHYDALKKLGPCPIHRRTFNLKLDEEVKMQEELF